MGRSAAFFDLDRTVIAKSSALAFGKPFYRDGLLKRRDVIKAAYAQLMFRLGATDEAAMSRMRDYLANLCRGWQVEQVRQIVTETLDELIHPYIYAEAGQLIEQHRAAGRDVVLVSASGEEIVRPIGEMLGVDDVIATRMAVADGRYFTAKPLARPSGNRVGTVFGYAGEQSWCMVLVRSYEGEPAVSDGSYAVELVRTDGRRARMGRLVVRGGSGSLGSALGFEYRELRAVRILRPDGSVLATATLH